MVTRGFTGRRVNPETAARLPPGQHVTQDFPVLSASPTPEIDLGKWKFTLKRGSRPIASWSWMEFNELPRTHWTGDIHHDHQAVARASLHSCRHVPRLLMYRSNWYHSTLDFRGNFYVDITDYLDIKEQAVRAHASEIERTGAKWINFFRNEAENAGQRIGVKYAEVFEVVKWLEK